MARGMGVAGTRCGRQDDGTRPQRRIRTGPPPPPQNLWAGRAAAADKGRSDDADNVDARGRRNLRRVRFEEVDHSLTEEGDRGVGNRRRQMLQPPDDEDIEDIRHAVGGPEAEGAGGGGSMDWGRGNSLRQCLTLSDRAERAPKGRSSNRDWGSGEVAEATVAEDLSR